MMGKPRKCKRQRHCSYPSYNDSMNASHSSKAFNVVAKEKALKKWNERILEGKVPNRLGDDLILGKR